MKPFTQLLMIFLLFVLLSCNHEDIRVSKDIDTLSEDINLKVKPLSVKWTFFKIGNGILGPSDYTITAIMKYSHSDWLKLYKKHQKSKEAETGYLSKEEFLKDWYPKSVKDCFIDTGKFLKVSKTLYNVETFSKFSFIHGFCFFTDNDEVFLYTYTM